MNNKANRQHVMNIDEAPLQDWSHGQHFQARLCQIGKSIGARKLGCRLVALPPGKAAWPLHAHFVNEELFVIIEGQGCLRLGNDRQAVRAGDVISIPPGPDTPHQIVNDSDTQLRYLCISTMEEPDIVSMPESEKIGIIAGSPPGGARDKRTLTAWFRLEDQCDYWVGEPD